MKAEEISSSKALENVMVKTGKKLFEFLINLGYIKIKQQLGK